jgi:hypothetical protein
MTVITLEPHQYDQWNSFVDESPQGDVFCYSWWLEAITKSDFKILAIFENNEIVAGMPLAFDAGSKVNIPPLTRTLGVLFRKPQYQSERKQSSVERKWLQELLKYMPLNDFAQMCTHHNFTDWLPFRWNGFSQTTRYTYIINYSNKTIDDLWNKIELETRRIIRKATENKIKVEITDDFELIYKYESMTFERQGLKFGIPFNDLKLLDDAAKQRGNRAVFKAVDSTGKVHAALYVAFNQKSAYALLSGGDPELRNLGGHTLVMWEAVRYFRDKTGFFNFGGSDIERIEGHLKGFGGTLTPYFLIYNEKMVPERNSARHHLKKVFFHFIALLKIAKNKLQKILRHK